MNENIILTLVFSSIPLFSSLLLIVAPEEVVPGRKYSKLLNFSLSTVVLILAMLMLDKMLFFILFALLLLLAFLNKSSLLSEIIVSLSSSYLAFVSIKIQNLPLSSSVIILLLSAYWLFISDYSKSFSIDKEIIPKSESWKLIRKSLLLSSMMLLFSLLYSALL